MRIFGRKPTLTELLRLAALLPFFLVMRAIVQLGYRPWRMVKYMEVRCWYRTPAPWLAWPVAAIGWGLVVVGLAWAARILASP